MALRFGYHSCIDSFRLLWAPRRSKPSYWALSYELVNLRQFRESICQSSSRHAPGYPVHTVQHNRIESSCQRSVLKQWRRRSRRSKHQFHSFVVFFEKILLKFGSPFPQLPICYISRRTPILQDFHICHIHPKEENHILSGKSDTLADLFRHICLKLLSEMELRS